MPSCQYDSPLGDILITAEEDGLTGVWFVGQRYAPETIPVLCRWDTEPILAETVRWLDGFFGGEIPDSTPPIRWSGTPFRKTVWKKLLAIPYGKTVTYGQLAKEIAGEQGMEKLSPQAVGGAVGHNPISLIVPCHRVVGADGSLTGYAGGTERKAWLLAMERGNSLLPGYVHDLNQQGFVDVD